MFANRDKDDINSVDNYLEHSAHVSYIDNYLKMASVRSQKMFCGKMQSLKICKHLGILAILHQYLLFVDLSTSSILAVKWNNVYQLFDLYCILFTFDRQVIWQKIWCSSNVLSCHNEILVCLLINSFYHNGISEFCKKIFQILEFKISMASN